jgi:glycerol-3-phosphate dehydrogenase
VDLTRSDVAGAFAGLRPLATDPGGNPGSTVKASREHRIRTESNGLVRISGGKFTTYRVMALQAVDAAMGPAAAGKRPSRSHETPIVGAAAPAALVALGARLATDAGLERSSADRLVARYGTEASDVVRLGQELGLLRPLGTGALPLEVEVVWSVRHESALSIDDFLARRTRLAQEQPDRAATVAERVAELAGRELGWSAKDRGVAVQAYLRGAHREYDVPQEGA